MILRSLLFVPGDSERKLAKAESSPADVLILDLEDSVAPERTEMARGMVREYLAAHPDRRGRQIWVRVNPVSTGKALPDLAAVVRGGPDGILQPKTDSGADVALLDHYLSALEHRDGIAPGSIRIVPVASETPRAVLAFDSYRGCSPRLAALTWGAEDLAAALGASANRVPDGSYEFTYRMARSLCLVAAKAACVEAIDTIWADFRDAKGLREDCEAARRAGFAGKLAIHPDQVPIINEAFSPSAGDVEYARRVVAAFAQGAGAVGLDGKMLDMPHLKQAQHVLALAERLRKAAS